MKFVAAMAVLLTLLVPLRGDDQVWALTDGRVVQVSKVLSQTPTHVTVRCAEGLLQIDKRQLPTELQEKYPYDSTAAAQAQHEQQAAQARRDAMAAQEKATAGQRMSQVAPPRQTRETKPLRIVNVRPEGPDTAYVTIANSSEDTFDILRDAFIGVNGAAEAFPATRLTNPRGDLLTKVRIGPNETIDVGVVFRIPADGNHDIGSVRFRQ